MDSNKENQPSFSNNGMPPTPLTALLLRAGGDNNGIALLNTVRPILKAEGLTDPEDLYDWGKEEYIEVGIKVNHRVKIQKALKGNASGNTVARRVSIENSNVPQPSVVRTPLSSSGAHTNATELVNSSSTASNGATISAHGASASNNSTSVALVNGISATASNNSSAASVITGSSYALLSPSRSCTGSLPLDHIVPKAPQAGLKSTGLPDFLDLQDPRTANIHSLLDDVDGDNTTNEGPIEGVGATFTTAEEEITWETLGTSVNKDLCEDKALETLTKLNSRLLWYKNNVDKEPFVEARKEAIMKNFIIYLRNEYHQERLRSSSARTYCRQMMLAIHYLSWQLSDEAWSCIKDLHHFFSRREKLDQEAGRLSGHVALTHMDVRHVLNSHMDVRHVLNSQRLMNESDSYSEQ